MLLETPIHLPPLHAMKSNPLEWKLNLNPNHPVVEAFTEKWRYEVHDSISMDGRWAVHREFKHRGLSGCLIGELLEDAFYTFEEALAAAERWHAERDDDYDLEWIARQSYLTGHSDY